MPTSTLILLFTAVFLSSAQVCKPNSALPNIESAIIEAAPEGGNLALIEGEVNSAYQYQLVQSFKAPPQVAVALTSFDISASTAFSFVFLPVKVTTTSVGLGLKTYWNGTRWSKLKFSLIAAARPDIQLGIVIYQNFTGSANYSISIAFKKPINASQGYILRTFLSGVLLADITNALDIKFNSSGPMNNSHQPLIVSSRSSIGSLSISYILFNPLSSNFVSYGGSIEIGTSDYTSGFSLLKSLSAVNSFLYGLVSFSLGNTLGQNSIYSSIGPDFILGCVPNKKVDELIVSYVLLGPSPNSVCADCPGKLPYYNQECKSFCGLDEVLYTYPDGSTGCVVCNRNANLIKSGRQCVCRPGTTLLNNICQAPVERISDYLPSSTPLIPVTFEPNRQTSLVSFQSAQTQSKDKDFDPFNLNGASYWFEENQQALATIPSSVSNSQASVTSTTNASNIVKPIFGNPTRVQSQPVDTQAKTSAISLPPFNQDPVASPVTQPFVRSPWDQPIVNLPVQNQPTISNSASQIQSTTFASPSGSPSPQATFYPYNNLTPTPSPPNYITPIANPPSSNSGNLASDSSQTPLCPLGFVYDYSFQKCIQSLQSPSSTSVISNAQAPKNSPSPLITYCPPGFVFNGRTCEPDTNPKKYSAGTTTQQIITNGCPLGSYWDGTKCVQATPYPSATIIPSNQVGQTTTGNSYNLYQAIPPQLTQLTPAVQSKQSAPNRASATTSSSQTKTQNTFKQTEPAPVAAVVPTNDLLSALNNIFGKITSVASNTGPSL